MKFWDEYICRMYVWWYRYLVPPLEPGSQIFSPALAAAVAPVSRLELLLLVRRLLLCRGRQILGAGLLLRNVINIIPLPPIS